MKKMKRFIATMMAVAMTVCLLSVPSLAVEAEAGENKRTVIENSDLSIARTGFTQFVTFDAGQFNTEKGYRFTVTKPCTLKLALYVRGADVSVCFKTPFGNYYEKYEKGSDIVGEPLLGGDKVPAGSYAVTISPWMDLPRM